MPAPIALEFYSRLPVRTAPPQSATLTRDLVLLVEDDEPIAGLLARILERMQWRVAVAGDAAQCLRLLETHRAEVALALIDCSLPDAHGGSLCANLRAAVPGLPVLLTSGRTQPGLLELVAADGPAAFLSKPFLPGDVMLQVRALLPARAA